jgi:hypothetical protein
MTSSYGIQVGALESQELRQQPIPFWLISFSDTVKGPFKRFFSPHLVVHTKEERDFAREPETP